MQLLLTQFDVDSANRANQTHALTLTQIRIPAPLFAPRQSQMAAG
jgi:hypothetical protein